MSKIYKVVGGTMEYNKGYHMFPVGSLVVENGPLVGNYKLLDDTSMSFNQLINKKDLKEIKNKS